MNIIIKGLVDIKDDDDRTCISEKQTLRVLGHFKMVPWTMQTDTHTHTKARQPNVSSYWLSVMDIESPWTCSLSFSLYLKMFVMKWWEGIDKEKTKHHTMRHDMNRTGKAARASLRCVGTIRYSLFSFSTSLLPLCSSSFAILLMGKIVVTCTQSNMARRILVNRRRSEKL